MIVYEYCCERLGLSEDEQNIASLAILPPEFMDLVNNKVLALISQKGSEGWEALYPFAVPVLWFKREKKTRAIPKKSTK